MYGLPAVEVLELAPLYLTCSIPSIRSIFLKINKLIYLSMIDWNEGIERIEGIRTALMSPAYQKDKIPGRCDLKNLVIG
jgi:hypothetical protein